MGKSEGVVLKFHNRKAGSPLRTFWRGQQVTPDRSLATRLHNGLAGQHVLASVRKDRDKYLAHFIRRVEAVGPNECQRADVLIDGQYFLKGAVAYMQRCQVEPEFLLQRMLGCFRSVGQLRFYICPDSVLPIERPLLCQLEKQVNGLCLGARMTIVELAAKTIHARHGDLIKSNVDTVMAADAAWLLGLAQQTENRAMVLVTGDGDFARIGNLCIGMVHDLPSNLRPKPRPFFVSAFRDGSLARELMEIINHQQADVVFFEDLL